MNRQTLCVSLFAAIAIALPAAAQEVTNLPEGTRQSISIDLGLESAVTTRASYSLHLGPGVLYGRFTLPVAHPNLKDLAFEAGGQATALASGNWKLQVAFAPVLRLTENDFFSATALGVRAALMPGYHADSWGLMAELGYEKMLATHMNHSSMYRNLVYSGAKDGWYSSTGGTLQVGLRGGYRIGHVELTLAAGLRTSEGLNAVAPPFYGTLGTGYSF
jgi:hypothetical protein